jgi:hypothetical protein
MFRANTDSKENDDEDRRVGESKTNKVTLLHVN